MRRTSTPMTRGPDVGERASARAGCRITVTVWAARSPMSASSPQPVTTTSCMLKTALTASGAPSAYRNWAQGSTYVRFGSTTRTPYGRRSRSTPQGVSLEADAKADSSLELLPALLADRSLHRWLPLLGGRRHGMPRRLSFDSHRFDHSLDP